MHKELASRVTDLMLQMLPWSASGSSPDDAGCRQSLLFEVDIEQR